MPSASVTLSGYLTMPNGQSVWADEVRLEVEYDYTPGTDGPVTSDLDFTVVDVLERIFATDDLDNEVVLSLSADHPAITQLARRKSHKIADDCVSDWQLEAA